MASIRGIAVLVVDDDVDTRELLEMYLEGEGATVRSADTAHAARALLAEASFDIVLTDASLPDEDGFAFVAALRADPATRSLPAIAITGHGDARSRSLAVESGFQKFITKPFDVFALPAAIASVVAERVAPPADETERERIVRLIGGRDMRVLLGSLNARTAYRYTSILRFDDGRIESVWTFDRNDESADRFPLDTPVSASYCALVQAGGVAFSMEDSARDARVEGHPKRESLRSYCGVPLFREDGSLFGTLCHYDEQPHVVEDATVAAMEQVAELLVPALSPAAADP